MDVVDKSIAEAKQNGVVCIKNSAARKYPYDDETFHLITSTDVLEHLHPNDVSVAVSEIYRVCRKNGHALLAPAVKPDNTGKLHLTVKPVKWWTDHFEEAGFTVICFTGPDGILLRKK